MISETQVDTYLEIAQFSEGYKYFQILMIIIMSIIPVNYVNDQELKLRVNLIPVNIKDKRNI